MLKLLVHSLMQDVLPSYSLLNEGSICGVRGIQQFSIPMPHDFFKNTSNSQTLYFLIELFGLSTNQFEFLESVKWFEGYARFCV